MVVSATTLTKSGMSGGDYHDFTYWGGVAHPLWVVPFPDWDSGLHQRKMRIEPACSHCSLPMHKATSWAKCPLPWLSCYDRLCLNCCGNSDSQLHWGGLAQWMWSSLDVHDPKTQIKGVGRVKCSLLVKQAGSEPREQAWLAVWFSFPFNGGNGDSVSVGSTVAAASFCIASVLYWLAPVNKSDLVTEFTPSLLNYEPEWALSPLRYFVRVF